MSEKPSDPNHLTTPSLALASSKETRSTRLHPSLSRVLKTIKILITAAMVYSAIPTNIASASINPHTPTALKKPVPSEYVHPPIHTLKILSDLFPELFAAPSDSPPPPDFTIGPEDLVPKEPTDTSTSLSDFFIDASCIVPKEPTDTSTSLSDLLFDASCIVPKDIEPSTDLIFTEDMFVPKDVKPPSTSLSSVR